MAGDHAGVAVRPPFVYAGALVVAALLHEWVPLVVVPDGVRRPLAWALSGAGLALVVWCFVAFVGHRTTVDTHRRPSALITTGPFRWSRNPIYVALSAAYLGVAVSRNWGWALVLLVPVLVTMNRGVIAREERYLETLFGDAYIAYRRRVRRWL